jgi:hypothetical protein
MLQSLTCLRSLVRLLALFKARFKHYPINYNKHEILVTRQNPFLTRNEWEFSLAF